MDTPKSWIIQVDSQGQVLAATPLPQAGVIASGTPQSVQVSRDESPVNVQSVTRSRSPSESSSAGWIPCFLTGAILISVGGFITDKLIGVIHEQRRELELERTEQKGFERGLQFQSSTTIQFYATASDSNTCEHQRCSSEWCGNALRSVSRRGVA